MIRIRLAAALVVALLFAGCTKSDAPAQTNAIAPGTLAGTVTDVALVPIAGVNVTVEGTNMSALTDSAGAFSFQLLPGEYVVIASHDDFKPTAQRASVLSIQTSSLALQLDAIPRQIPRVDAAEGAGYLACQALVLVGEDRTVTPCGSNDPNDSPSVEFPLDDHNGLETVVVQLVWEPATKAADSLRLEVAQREGDQLTVIGATEGPSPLTLALPGRVVSGNALVLTAGPAGGFTDEEAGVDGGIVLQQAFDALASFFYWAPAPGGYSAIQSSA